MTDPTQNVAIMAIWMARELAVLRQALLDSGVVTQEQLTQAEQKVTACWAIENALAPNALFGALLATKPAPRPAPQSSA
jgi:hypothetical protein